MKNMYMCHRKNSDYMTLCIYAFTYWSLIFISTLLDPTSCILNLYWAPLSYFFVGLEQKLRHQIGTQTQAIEKLWFDYHLASENHDAVGAISNLMHPSCLDSCDSSG
jgi:hypothetical protein